ncbi:hypothetical protein BYT27DRAFT_6467163 [Phlegmacium glaucopus]|nr:hypothetical protein BYT27DRAFT_6467163 [Phlegmacium glaucopus]
MAYKSSTNDPPLPSGVYAIRSATADEPYMAPQNFNDDRIVITEESVPFKWLVTDVGNQKYTLQVEQTKEYAVTSKQDTIVKLANYEQVYAIISAGPEKDGKTYYQIWTQDNRCFKYNGDDKAVTAVAYDPTKEIDYLWLFDLLETPESGTGTGDEYEIYPGSFYYFRYDGITTENPVLDRFGLRDTSDDRWVRFWDGINKLNEKGDGNVLYKVLFLGRHGHATHNPAPEAVTAPDCPQRDSPLTQNGYLQACNVEAHWTTENSLAKGGIGIPQISYCSPLMRCLVTNTLSFSPQLDADGGPTINTVVYDDCREWLYNSETGYRRSKDCISEMFSKFTVDPDLPPTDTLWVESEDADAIMARARGILDRIFKVESKDKQFVSITAHAGIISAMISVMDCDPRIFNLVNGCVIPIICQYTPGDGNKLPDGYYKIRYVPEPSLFADGVQIGEPVVASNMTSFEFPSTVRDIHGSLSLFARN